MLDVGSPNFGRTDAFFPCVRLDTEALYSKKQCPISANVSLAGRFHLRKSLQVRVEIRAFLLPSA